MMKKKILILSSILTICLTCCGNVKNNIDGNSTKNTYTVTWKNWDNSILEIDYNVSSGIYPTYNGSIPTRPEDQTHEYTFIGWSPSLSLVTSDITYYAQYQSNDLATYHTVCFDTNGGGDIMPQQIKHGEKINRPADPERPGFVFANWTYLSEDWSFVGYVVTEDMTLVAHWTIINYSITYILNGGTNDSSNPSTYTVEDDITLADPIKTGYTFLGWFDDNGNKVTKINAGTTNDLVLTARWNDGNEYCLILDPNGGSVSEYSLIVQYNHNYCLPVATRLGYTFDGWYDNSTKVKREGVWEYSTDMTLVAHWTIINYSITYILNGGTNDSSNPSTYTVEDDITLADPIKTGYTFLGWFDGDSAVYQIKKGTIGDIVIESKWSPILNSLNVISENESLGIVEIVSGQGYSDESVTIKATPLGESAFDGWYSNSILLSKDPEYTFIMPKNDLTIIASFLSKDELDIMHGIKPYLDEEKNTFTYGLYPNKHVSDDETIQALENISALNPQKMCLYHNDYYIKLENATPYYSDHWGYEGFFDEHIEIVNGASYWFKCEPIEWIVLEEGDGDYLLLSKYVLDHHLYYDSEEIRNIDGKTIYPANYEYSNVRLWLNGVFYNFAFGLGGSYLQTMLVDNHTGIRDKYASQDTSDFVALPSKIELENYYGSTYDFGWCASTEWARANGLYADSGRLYSSCYYTRTPRDDYYSYYVDYDGHVNSEYVVRTEGFYDGIRPIINIKMN